MKGTNFKKLFAIVIAALLFTATSISLQPNPSAFAFDQKKQGQDYKGKNCERIETKEKSTFGKCESVCKDKEITKKDVENNRYVCKAALTLGDRRPVDRVPVDAKVQDVQGSPKPQSPAAPKSGKSKKN
jgi:hypothetical protein